MAKQFISLERLAQYDDLIKKYIKESLKTSEDNSETLETLIGGAEVEGSIQHQINQAIADLLGEANSDNKIDNLREVLDYLQTNGGALDTIIATYNSLAEEVGKEATETEPATGLYAKIADAETSAVETIKELEINAVGGEEVKVTLSGTVANPTLDVVCTFCTEQDIEKLFIPVLQATSYSELVDAIASAAPGQTIKIQSPIAQQVTIPADKEVVLDLNGQTISSTGSAIINNGILTISDNSLGRSNGAIVSSGNCGIAAGNNSVTTILSGTISGQEGAVITSKSSGAVINIEGGNLSAADNAVIAGNGTKREGEPNVINISGGRFESNIQSKGYIACGVYAPWKDTINITGGEFIANNGCGVLARAGQVNIEGGTFTTTGSITGWVGDNKNQVPCAAVVFDSNANYPGMDENSKITISGGTFNSEVDPIQTLGDSERILDLR